MLAATIAWPPHLLRGEERRNIVGFGINAKRMDDDKLHVVQPRSESTRKVRTNRKCDNGNMLEKFAEEKTRE